MLCLWKHQNLTDISGWNVFSSVTNMSYMFSQASSFNQHIRIWSVDSAAGFYSMFTNATQMINTYLAGASANGFGDNPRSGFLVNHLT